MKAFKRPLIIDFEFAISDGIIDTLEGRMKYKTGDAIITGVRGEKYVCRRDIFDETYTVLGWNDKSSENKEVK
jgi:hypothetical protein